ncbi:MAG: GFA family protein [Pseudomonadota bacterium]
MSTPETYRGGCLCGAVLYEIEGPLRSVVGCHCVQCRKTSGHHVAATQGDADKLRITGGERLTWYRSSPEAERGFCADCGSNLFWRRIGNPMISIFAGTLQDGHGLTMECHIHADTPGAHYVISDGLPQIDQSELT